jgi:hypothetical protein
MQAPLHTPGPWVAVGTEVVAPATEKVICRSGTFHIDAINRNLIAAAPDMLAALRDCIDQMADDTLAAVIRARAAIAKAEGK